MRIFAKKGLGQHFLMHRQTAERIVLAAGVTKEDTVLEIGPGTGLLTRELLNTAQRVYAVETDAELIPELSETFAKEIAEKRLILIEEDIRKFDPGMIAGPYTLVANIPYYITGEIIRTFLGARYKPTSMTLLVQKEVAERIARSQKESLLSLAVKVYGVPRYDFTVPRGAFRPAPSVDSAVLTILDIRMPFKDTEHEAFFFSVLRAGFAHKRKRLQRNLEEVVEKERIAAAFEMLGMNPDLRPEALNLSGWLSLVEKLS